MSASSPLVIVGGGVVALVLVLGVLVALRRRREARASDERQPGPPDWDAVPRAFPAGGLDELASEDTTVAAPVPVPEDPPLFWWWMERTAEGQPAARVVILTKDLLLLSGPLGRDQVAELHAAQDRGDLLDADLGDDPSLALLSTVVGMEHDGATGVLRVESHVGADHRVLSVCPPADQAGIGAAVHQVLVDRLGDRRPVQDAPVIESPSPTSDLPF